MSFWENNKGTFKSAGKSVVNGSKSVGQAGYRTFKKNEAKRKGIEYVDPIPGESKSGETYIPYQPAPLPSKETLHSFQPPPKRNVGAYSVPKRGEASHYAKPATPATPANPAVQQPAATNPQTQQPVQYQQPQQEQAPPVYQLEEQPQEQPQQGAYQRPAYTSPQQGYNQNVQDTPQRVTPTPGIQYQQAPPPQMPSQQRAGAPQLPLRSNVPPSLPSRNSTANVTSQPVSYVKPAAQSTSYPQTATQQPQEPPKPKSVLPDPSSFAPPPRRVDLPPLNVRRGSQGSSSSAATTVTTLSQPGSQAPVLPTRSNDSETSLPMKKKPPKPKKLQVEQSVQQEQPTLHISAQQFNLNSFPNPRQTQQTEAEDYTNPPKPPRPIEEAEYANPPKPPRPQNNELTPPPMPARRTTNGGIPPPMPVRKSPNEIISPTLSTGTQSDLPELSYKKAPPPKPLKKPSTSNILPPAYTGQAASTAQGDVLNELNNIFQRMHVNEDTQRLTTNLETKISPEIATKRKEKPVIATKPTIENKPEKSKPPVPEHRQTTPQKSPTPPPVPPSRNYSRAAAPAPTPVPAPSQAFVTAPVTFSTTQELVPPKPSGPPNLDLELQTGWFAKRDGPLQLPKSLEGSNYKTSFLTGMGFTGTQTFNITARLKDLSVISYKFEYSTNNISDVKVVMENYIPSPLDKVPTQQELITNHERFGEYVASWCEHHKGKTVGRGECWDLAKEALQKGCGNYAFVSTYVVHGYPILQVANSGNGIHFINSNQQLDEIRRGDILQFKTCTFYDAATGVTGTCGQPDHTAIVVGKEGDKLILLEQNLGGRRYVVDGECIIKNLTQGEMYVYRPMPKEWAGDI